MNRLHPMSTAEWLFGDGSVSPEQRLFQAVATQAAEDAVSRAKSADAAYYRREAIDWLMSAGRDFVWICLHAGYDPSWLHTKAKRTLESPRPVRAPAGEGKDYERKRKQYQRMKISNRFLTTTEESL